VRHWDFNPKYIICILILNYIFLLLIAGTSHYYVELHNLVILFYEKQNLVTAGD